MTQPVDPRAVRGAWWMLGILVAVIVAAAISFGLLWLSASRAAAGVLSRTNPSARVERVIPQGFAGDNAGFLVLISDPTRAHGARNGELDMNIRWTSSGRMEVLSLDPRWDR